MEEESRGLDTVRRALGVASLAALAWVVVESVLASRRASVPPLLDAIGIVGFGGPFFPATWMLLSIAAEPLEWLLPQIDAVTVRGLSWAFRWPWSSTAQDGAVEAVLAGRARVATAYAGFVVASLAWAARLPTGKTGGKAWPWQGLRGWSLAGAATLLSAVAVMVLAWLELGNALGPNSGGLGLYRLVRLSLTTVTAAGHVALVLGAVRAAAGTRLATSDEPGHCKFEPRGNDWAEQFRGLVLHECRRIMAARRHLRRPSDDAPVPERRPDCPDVEVVSARPSSGEPFVAFRSGDMTGLALSGGGIRSATFNLGILQGLHRVGLLGKFDYLSTVSGGGYVGSFWSSWMARRGTKANDWAGTDGTHNDFPSELDPKPPRQRVDSDEVRHLREFGNFLVPRMGLFDVETWTAIVAVLSGLLPAGLIALSLIAGALIVWLTTMVPLAMSARWPSMAVVAVVTTAVLVLFELRWRSSKLPPVVPAKRNPTDTDAPGTSPRKKDLWWNICFGLVAVGLAAMLAGPPLRPSADDTSLSVRESLGGLGRLPVDPQSSPCSTVSRPNRPLVRLDGCWYAVPDDGHAWWTVAGLGDRSGDYWFFSPVLFTYPAVWALTGLLLLVGRQVDALWPSRDSGTWVPALDRTIMRVLGLAVFWAALVVLWHVAVALDRILATAILAASSAGGFALLRNWLVQAGQSPSSQGRTSALKQALPQVLAYLTLILTAAGVGQLLVWWCGAQWYRWWSAFSAASGVLVVGLFIDPGKFGLHAFYRARISRAYAGANNLGAGETALENRLSEPRNDDDPRLSSLPARPLHLVCCAANDLSGDAVGTLGRHSRSAVLSPYGISIGPHAGPVPGLTLGSAVTASAAAFNSNMGDVSTRFGPAVTFLMTALNLRLGLWVRHPDAYPALPRRWPGILLYREFFGLTSASGETRGTAVPPRLRDLHLSDGGHFENLGLYELVRRHCRYVLVCDCGADPTVAFDDLGRALRRIRQDFGIDISIDVDALRPDDRGYSKQHVAIGRIHYAPTDAGILIYVKPTLTGDEPGDVLQYRGRNRDFPHESTGDQFYDEAQWESYRRLGLHVADTIFHFVPPSADPASGAGVEAKHDRDKQARGSEVTADYVFAEAAHRWGPTPPGLGERVLEMTKRVIAFETDLKADKASALLGEVFPELGTLRGEVKPDPSGAGEELVTILRLTQLMEDVWSVCELERWWAHPLNMGWVNFFGRWVTAPAFRFWWPVMGPMYAKGFRDFLDDRFPWPEARERTDRHTGLPWQGLVKRMETTEDAREKGLAEVWWETRSAQPCPWLTGTTPTMYLQNTMALQRNDQEIDLQVGLAAIWLEDRRAFWTSDDFFVPPSLWGASIGWYFLDGILNYLAAEKSRTHVYVAVTRDQIDGNHRIALDDTRAFADQYRKMGFQQVICSAPTWHPAEISALVRQRGLACEEGTLTPLGRRIEAWLRLDLDVWTAQRGSRATKEARWPESSNVDRAAGVASEATTSEKGQSTMPPAMPPMPHVDWAATAAMISAMVDVVRLGRDSFDSYFARHAKAPDAHARGRGLELALSTYSAAEVQAIAGRIDRCRQRFIDEGAGEGRRKCLCSVLRDVRDGNGGSIPDQEWQGAFDTLRCASD